MRQKRKKIILDFDFLCKKTKILRRKVIDNNIKYIIRDWAYNKYNLSIIFYNTSDKKFKKYKNELEGLNIRAFYNLTESESDYRWLLDFLGDSSIYITCKERYIKMPYGNHYIGEYFKSFRDIYLPVKTTVKRLPHDIIRTGVTLDEFRN